MKENEQRIIFLQGQKTILRPLDKKTDLEKCVRWMNDQEIVQYLAMYLPVSLDGEGRWFDNLVGRESDIVLAIETLDRTYIGNIGLHGIHWKDKRAVYGIFIGEKDYWGKGYGTDAAVRLFGYAFNSLGLNKINSSVIAFNERSLKHHFKCGFKKVGRYRQQFFRQGKFWDEVVLDMFKEDWQMAREKMEK